MPITSFSYFSLVLITFAFCSLIIKGNESKKTFLLIVSYYFYMTFDWRFSLLLLFLTLVNFYSGYVISKSSSQSLKRCSLYLSVVISLGVLFYFKYFNFFLDSFYVVLNHIGIKGQSHITEIILPLGISFITFQAITYPIDVYNNRLSKTASLKDFSLFMAFFPQLLSGPILRAHKFIPQLEEKTKESSQQIITGMTLVLCGLIKKVIIADTLALHIVDPAFDNPSELSSLFLILALFAYSFQVYMDLSGYTDIALGVAKMFGYKLPHNFNRPYMATSISNFWQRWHITMSSFFRDYLYEAVRKWHWSNIYFNLLIVFIAIGLWHGAGWNFVLYGTIHGTLVGLEHYRSKVREEKGLPPIIYRGFGLFIRVLQVFTIVTLTRLLFRSETIQSSIDYLELIITTSSTSFPMSNVAILAFTVCIICHFTPITWRDKLMRKFDGLPEYAYAASAVFIVYITAAFSNDIDSFIYFQF
ncbi:MBOAT family protein [Photobacterium sanctipauli]|uniref:Probable alginate O-acetylase n=1 Tax=Photobacterium sanctipauli TaxID=1342794 RepID=A0A2T3NAG7_9GAMM|nr:MBOAT family O-acyltransferase [Photobacterium sanctipauli]PSW10744.1 MBOAT family protein [Photobacterium sanctipauli]